MKRTPVYCCSSLCFAVALLFALPASAQQRGAPKATGTPSRGGGVQSDSDRFQRDVPEKLSPKLEETYERMTKEARQPAAKRDYEVVTGELKRTKLFRADPKLPQNKFVALIEISTRPGETTSNPAELVTSPQGFFGRSTTDELRQRDREWYFNPERIGSAVTGYPSDLKRLVQWDGRLLFTPQGIRPGESKTGLSEQNKLFLEHCAPEDRPSPALAEFLTSAECDRDVLRGVGFGEDRGTNLEGWTYLIYAPTSEDAEARAGALLKLLDGGLFKPMQRHLAAEGRKQLEAARKEFAEVARLSDEIRSELAKIAKPSEISADILSQLKAQKVMVAVELSGLNARVKACDEMLKDPRKLEVSALQSISDMKVKAEIERVGIKEKLDQINVFIKEGDEREATQGRYQSLLAKRSGQVNNAHRPERDAAVLAGLYDLYAPLPLKNNQITISPVEWTN